LSNRQADHLGKEGSATHPAQLQVHCTNGRAGKGWKWTRAIGRVGKFFGGGHGRGASNTWLASARGPTPNDGGASLRPKLTRVSEHKSSTPSCECVHRSAEFAKSSTSVDRVLLWCAVGKEGWNDLKWEREGMADGIQAQAFAAIKGRETTSGRVTAFSELDCRAVGSLRALAMAMAGFFFLDKLWTPTFGCCAWGDIGNGRHAADSPRMVNSQANKHNGAITTCGCPNEGGNGGAMGKAGRAGAQAVGRVGCAGDASAGDSGFVGSLGGSLGSSLAGRQWVVFLIGQYRAERRQPPRTPPGRPSWSAS